MSVRKAKKLARRVLILLLIFSLFTTSFPPALFANKNDITTVVEDGLSGPKGVAVDSPGNIYILEADNRVRKVAATTGAITTLVNIDELGSLGGAIPVLTA